MAEAELTKGERTAQTILEAAYTLFLEQGYAATSMRQIAKRSGLALGGIYNHFASKEAIFSDLIISKHPFHQIIPLLQAAPGDTVEEFVRNAAKSMVGELGRRPDFVKFLFVELVEFNGRDVSKMFQIVYPQIAPLIQRFQDSRGELRKIPPFVLFRAFLGLFFSFYMTEFLLAGTPAAAMQENALDHFVDIFLHGVMADKELSSQ
jgi:AcrR family transcriptional regulator